MAEHEIYQRVHPILGYALRAMDEARRPPPPYAHTGGGPAPKIDSWAQARLAAWLGSVVRHQVPADALERYDGILAQAEAWIAADREGRRMPEELRKAASARRSRGPLAVAQLAASSLTVRYDMVYRTVAASVERVVRLLQEAGEADRVRQLIGELDRRIVLEECQEAVSRYAPEPAPVVARVLWRADRGNGTAGHFLCTLERSEDYGLITKMKNRWRFFSGARDEMLATLPDALFEEGTKACLAAEAG